MGGSSGPVAASWRVELRGCCDSSACGASGERSRQHGAVDGRSREASSVGADTWAAAACECGGCRIRVQRRTWREDLHRGYCRPRSPPRREGPTPQTAGREGLLLPAPTPKGWAVHRSPRGRHRGACLRHLPPSAFHVKREDRAQVPKLITRPDARRAPGRGSDRDPRTSRRKARSFPSLRRAA